MTEKRFRVNDLVKYNYSEIGEYIDENHTDKPLRNDELVELLNVLYEENKQIKDLIHTILNQIDVENITSDSTIYSARIIFSRNEFNLIRELWKR